ncbi:oxidoreductase, aldo/keto reductase family [Lachnospiraceae bacterium KM106-2]|nr:oxidoreductase, aldo/keto reductase family [Lachnospiraceae bacterium KM106-2]
MKYLNLNNGLKMPMIGFGTWALRGELCEQSVADAIDTGYRLIDTAQMYENELAVGKGIQKSGISRSELFITTKLYTPSNSYEKAKADIERSLQNLQLDYVDLMLIHEPYKESLEMYEALKEAYQEGKLRAIGISNFNASQYLDFIKHCEIIPVINQVESHVFYQQLELKAVMEEHGTKMQAWSPFAQGKKDFFHNQILKDIGEKYGKSIGQIALNYLVNNEIAVIPKSSHKERMQENMDSFDFKLSNEDRDQILQLEEGRSLFGWY